MIRVIIVGVSAHSRMLKKIIENHYNPYATAHGGEALMVVGFFDMFAEDTGEEVLDGVIVLNRANLPEILYSGEIGAVLIPEQPTLDMQFLMHWFRGIGVHQDFIYFAARNFIEKKALDESDMEELLIPYVQASYLPYLEFHIEDSCNMNCKACEHYSPLVKKTNDSRMVFEDVERDFLRLKELIDSIGRIRILGGEPLLNPELPKYVRMVRKIYPVADIFVVTNALLLDKLLDGAYEAMREANAYFMVSYYPPLEGKLDAKIEYANSKGVDVYKTPLIKEFSMRQNLNGNNDPAEEFDKCFQSTCNNLYKGRIAACMLPFMTHYFNETFDKVIPEDGAIDIYDNGLTTEELKKRLETPFERCAYCGNPINVPWQQAKREPDISDFVREENA